MYISICRRLEVEVSGKYSGIRVNSGKIARLQRSRITSFLRPEDFLSSSSVIWLFLLLRVGCVQLRSVWKGWGNIGDVAKDRENGGRDAFRLLAKLCAWRRYYWYKINYTLWYWDGNTTVKYTQIHSIGTSFANNIAHTEFNYGTWYLVIIIYGLI